MGNKCEHYAQANDQISPNTKECEGCEKEKTPWVALRMCLICGHVGCCDSSVGLHATKMAGQISEKNILIVGAGPIGLACAIWCNFFGARSVVISERSATRIEKAKELGFHNIVNPDEDVAEAFMEIVGNGPEIQFDCVGAPGIFCQLPPPFKLTNIPLSVAVNIRSFAT